MSYKLTSAKKVKIIDEPKHHWYSSARDYAEIKDLLNVELLDQ